MSDFFDLHDDDLQEQVKAQSGASVQPAEPAVIEEAPAQDNPAAADSADGTESDAAAGTAESAEAVEEGAEDGEDSAEGAALAAQRRGDITEPGTLMVYLLKGVVYRADNPVIYEAITKRFGEVFDLARRLGMFVENDTAEGYYYLRSLTAEDVGDETELPPRLLRCVRLPFETSFLLALLRQKIIEFDNNGGNTRYMMTFDDMVGLMAVYFPKNSDQTVLARRMSGQVKKLCELGFLRKISERGDKSGERYELKRIIKAIVNADKLKEFDELLESYKRKAGGESLEEDTAAKSSDGTESAGEVGEEAAVAAPAARGRRGRKPKAAEDAPVIHKRRGRPPKKAQLTEDSGLADAPEAGISDNGDN